MAKKKKRKRGIIVFLLVVAVFAAAGLLGWNLLEKEHQSILNLNYEGKAIDAVADGKYEGYYEGGKYGWRENKVMVTVEGGQVTDIELLYSKDGVPSEILTELYEKVIDSQSLDVDAVSEATITSKAYLKSVENALTD